MTTKEKEALDATGVAIADRIENCLALHAAGDCDNNKLYMEENCAKTCRLKYLEEQDKERKAELQKHLRSTTESPESEDEELMDDEELASRRAKLEAKREGKNKEDEDAFQRALQEFIMENTLDYELINYANAKLNHDIEQYGPGFNDDLIAFRQLLHSVHTHCSNLGEVEEDACIQQVAENSMSAGDL